VLIAIQLHDQLGRGTEKVGDEGSNCLLPPETNPNGFKTQYRP